MSNHPKVSLCIILLSLHLQRVNSNNEVEELASKLCPFTNFCFKKAVQEFHDETGEFIPCCGPCLCGEDCRRYGNCCPDDPTESHHTNSTNYHQLSCATTLVKPLLQPTVIGYPTHYTTDYNIVVSCENSDNVDMNDHRIGCETEDKHSLDQYIWVSDRVSGKIYKNWHCAVCAGVQNYVFWNIQTNCLEIFAQYLETVNAILVSDLCDIILRPPIRLTNLVRLYRCPKTAASYCTSEKARKLGDYGTVIEEACNSLDTNFIGDGLLWLKNIFCLACGLGNLTAVDPTCQNPYVSHRSGASFSLIFDYNSAHVLATNKRVEILECSIGEFKDRHTNKCRTLHCPVGSLALFGACTNVMLRIGVVQVNVSFYLELLSGSPILHDGGVKNDNETLSVAVYNRILDSLGFKNRCKYRSYSLWFDRRVDASGVGFIFWANMFVGDDTKCTFEFTFGRSVGAIGQTFDVVGNDGKNVSLLVNLEKRPYETISAESDLLLENQYSIDKLTDYDLPFGTKALRIQDTKLCPLVEIEYQELFSAPVELGWKLRSLFVDNEPIKNTTRVRVCVDDYESIMTISHVTSVQPIRYMVLMTGVTAVLDLNT